MSRGRVLSWSVGLAHRRLEPGRADALPDEVVVHLLEAQRQRGERLADDVGVLDRAFGVRVNPHRAAEQVSRRISPLGG